MLRTSPTLLRQTLEQLEQATLDHASWRYHLLRVFSGRRPAKPSDLAPDAHLHCLFGRWYLEQAPLDLRQLPSFTMLGVEHESQHRIAARLFHDQAGGKPLQRADVEEFEEASARLSYALYFVKREIECALRGRDPLTDAHTSEEMMRDLREWHALARQPRRRPSCIALLEIDEVRGVHAARAYSSSAQALAVAVKLVAAHLRLSDKVFRYDATKFLIRLSGTELAAARTVVNRLREIVMHELVWPDTEGNPPTRLTASFGLAPLDPDVEILESIDRADQALTLAKAAGGNRVIAWDASVTTGVRLLRLETKDVPG